MGLPVPTSTCFWLVYLGPLWQVRALIRFRDRFAVLVLRALEDGFAALLCRGQISVGKAVAVGAIGKRVDEGHQIGELLLIETLRAEEELLGARAAFGRHVGIAAIPFEGLGAGEVLERAVIDDVFAEAVGLEVPLQAVDGGVEMAIGAAELALEGEVGGVEEALAAAERVDVLRAAEIDGRYDFVWSPYR